MDNFHPTLGQMMFGNGWFQLDLGKDRDYVTSQLLELSKMLMMVSPASCSGGGWEGYGENFKNEVFEMHPYSWDDCACGFEEKDHKWSEEHPHSSICFHQRYKDEEKRLERVGTAFDKLDGLMIKWAKANGFASAPRGMAVHCDCAVDGAYQLWRAENDHASDCCVILPNFRCGDLEICWYKYIGRGMSINQEVSREQLRGVFRRCRSSIKQQYEQTVAEIKPGAVLTRNGRNFLKQDLGMHDAEIEALFKTVIGGRPELRAEALKTNFGKRVLGA